MRTHCHFTIAALIATASAPALAQKLPDDCSAAAVPTEPLEVSVGGVKFAPKAVKLRSAGYMVTRDEHFDSYQLTFRSEDNLSPALEADITVIVRTGERIDGRVFRRLPAKDKTKQPSASRQLPEPEVQGWTFKNRSAGLPLSSVDYVASVRLELGQRKWGAINGNIYLCVAKGQTTMLNKSPIKEDSYAVGTFRARIE